MSLLCHLSFHAPVVAREALLSRWLRWRCLAP